VAEPRSTYRVLKNEILSEAPNPVRRKVEGALPPDLGLSIMIVLSFHAGRHNTISNGDLCAELKDLRISDHQLREQIKQLRRSGHLIGSAAGENGGYYLITTPEELQEFLRTEYQAKIDDMRQTVESMTNAASQRWGPASIQLRML
jgi:hypothetical protein